MVCCDASVTIQRNRISAMNPYGKKSVRFELDCTMSRTLLLVDCPNIVTGMLLLRTAFQFGRKKTDKKKSYKEKTVSFHTRS